MLDTFKPFETKYIFKVPVGNKAGQQIMPTLDFGN
jgi:hypothetical protein